MARQEHPSHAGRTVRAEIRTRATPMQVWQAWADPVRLSQWFTDRARGEAKPGQRMTWIFDKLGFELPHDVLEAVPGERLVFRGTPPERPPYLLEILIAREGPETVVRLIHSGLVDGDDQDEEYDGVRSGWEMAMSILRHYLEHYYGEAKRTVLVMRPARFSYDAVLPYYKEEPLLATWLTSSGAIGWPDERFTLTLRDGERLSGQVLAVTSHEVAVSWEEEHAVLELKAFSAGPSRMLCMRIIGWAMSESRAAELERLCERALEKLDHQQRVAGGR